MIFNMKMNETKKNILVLSIIDLLNNRLLIDTKRIADRMIKKGIDVEHDKLSLNMYIFDKATYFYSDRPAEQATEYYNIWDFIRNILGLREHKRHYKFKSTLSNPIFKLSNGVNYIDYMQSEFDFDRGFITIIKEMDFKFIINKRVLNKDETALYDVVQLSFKEYEKVNIDITFIMDQIIKEFHDDLRC